MRAYLDEAQRWRTIVDAVTVLVPTTCIKAEASGFTLRAMDPAHIAMVEWDIPKNSFDEYECPGDLALWLDFESMARVMRRAHSKDSVELTVDEEAKRLTLTLRGRALRTFKTPVLDPAEGDPPTPPTVNHTAEATVEAATLRTAIRDAQAVKAEAVTLLLNQDGFKVHAVGPVGDVTVLFPKDGENESPLLDFNAAEEARALYAISYLADFMRVAGTSDSVKLRLATDRPVCLEFSPLLAGSVRYILAPWIGEI